MFINDHLTNMVMIIKMLIKACPTKQHGDDNKNCPLKCTQTIDSLEIYGDNENTHKRSSFCKNMLSIIKMIIKKIMFL